ncbi:MAG: hypothetical protein VXY94_05075 [Planctomycetota bacterium]|nr:hypothetical protein [Planctomycetota bacterium]MED5508555.1 hypothetical protein [Planctomycetota bacterium]
MITPTDKSRIPPELSGLVRSVRRRLWVGRLLGTLHDALLFAMLALLVVVLLAKATPLVAPDWWVILLALGGSVLLAGILMARIGRLSDGAIAALIDERLDLQDRFTTAIHCAHREDPFARAALEQCLETLREPSVRNRLRAAFAPRTPAGAWVAPVVGLFAGLLWFTVPSGDLFATDPRPDAAEADTERIAAEESIRAVLERIEENPALSEELGDLSEAFALDESRPDLEGSPEEARREALRKISDLEQRLDEIVNGERGQSMEALRQALSNIDPEDADATRDFAEALRSADFERAREAMSELERLARDPALDEADRARLGEELKSLAEQLESAAGDDEALRQALQQAGLDPDLANNPEALQQALEQASGLNEQQRQQLREMTAAQESSAEQCRQMSESLDSMARECTGGQSGSGEGRSGSQGMQKSLSEAEQLQQMLQMAKSAQGQCNGSGGSRPSGSSSSYADMLPSKPSSPRDDAARTMGGQANFRGEGRGGEGNAPISATEFSTRLQKEQVALQEGGDVISRQLVDSDAPVRGQSTLELQQLADSIIRSWEEGVEEQPIPGHLRDVHKHYFGELRKRIDDRRAASREPATTPPAEPEGGAEPEP